MADLKRLAYSVAWKTLTPQAHVLCKLASAARYRKENYAEWPPSDERHMQLRCPHLHMILRLFRCEIFCKRACVFLCSVHCHLSVLLPIVSLHHVDRCWQKDGGF